MPKYKATAYIRLSYTDDHSSESDSVSNQRKLIENFVERKGELGRFVAYVRTQQVAFSVRTYAAKDRKRTIRFANANF